MRIRSVRIKNFRRLKDVHFPLEEKTSIFVGANNSGKTSATQNGRRHDERWSVYQHEVAETRERAATAANTNELLRRYQDDAPLGTQKSVEDYVLWALNANPYQFAVDFFSAIFANKEGAAS